MMSVVFYDIIYIYICILQESHDIMRAFLAEAKRYDSYEVCNTVKAFASIAEAAALQHSENSV